MNTAKIYKILDLIALKKILIYVTVFLLVIWMIPVKIFISNKTLKNRTENLNGDIILICEYQAVTGPVWRVEEVYGTTNCPDSVDVIGMDVPELRLKSSIYNYDNCKFVFEGRFEIGEKSLFLVDSWDIIAPVFVNLYCLPYGLNLFQYNFKVSDKQNKENEKKTRELHKQYELDNVVE